MSSTSLRRRSAHVLSAVALMLGLLAATTSVARADTIPGPGPAGTSSTPAVADSAAAAHQAAASSDVVAPEGYWYVIGVFPDPLSCNVAGLASGRSFVCTWWFFVWVLELWAE